MNLSIDRELKADGCSKCPKNEASENVYAYIRNWFAIQPFKVLGSMNGRSPVCFLTSTHATIKTNLMCIASFISAASGPTTYLNYITYALFISGSVALLS